MDGEGVVDRETRDARQSFTDVCAALDHDDDDGGDDDDDERAVPNMHPALTRDGQLSTTYIRARARWGWLLVPYPFLHGGCLVGSVAALIYHDSVGLKVVASIAILTFGVGFPLYLWHTVCRGQPRHAMTVRVQPAPKKWRLRWLFWGDEEWVPIENIPEHCHWIELHHLAFDAYRSRLHGRFEHHAAGRLVAHCLLLETVHLMVLSVLAAWLPKNVTGCWEKTLIMSVVLMVRFLVRMVVWPRIAPYDNVGETVLAGIESTTMFGITIMLRDHVPADAPLGKLVSRLTLILLWGTIGKFVIGTVIFVIDEYTAWKERGGSGGKIGFAWHFLVGAFLYPREWPNLASVGLLEP
eukprot:gene51505-35496_t